MVGTTVTDTPESMRTDYGGFGVFLVVLGVTVFLGGCAVDQVLAGDSLTAQLWTVPLLGSCLTTWRCSSIAPATPESERLLQRVGRTFTGR